MSREAAPALTHLAIHVPRGRAAVGDATGLSGVTLRVPPRPVAGPDEDSVTMATEVARRVGADGAPLLALATSRPVYERTGTAAFVHAAAGMDPLESRCVDLVGGEGAAVAAIDLCRRDGGVAVLSDLVVGAPGSSTEAAGADAAVALRFARTDGPCLAHVERVRAIAHTDLVTWRLPGETVERTWRGRYTAHALRERAVALVDVVLGDDPPDVVAVSATDRRLAAAVARHVGVGAVTEPGIGPPHAGVADLGMVLDAALRTVSEGQRILLLSLGDQVSALTLLRGAAPMPEQSAGGQDEVPYAEYLSWRGLLARDTSGRPEPQPPSVPAIARQAAWKYRLVGARCRSCGTVFAPPVRVCLTCRVVDQMDAHPLADRRATVSTFTADHLAWGIRKPVCSAVVDFDGGGRMECEVADPDPARLRVGARVRMVLRRGFTSEGVHNYVWKALLVDEERS